ncbi:MAG: type II toxin-antitoxin system RelE/ParE family toxin [Deferribacteraceae bacterium]|jgi:toxin ParE1/3/4|nr:type II toxin-antitoxin system RelE/ParE family toxin [Deferribacteraceae bacterium]
MKIKILSVAKSNLKEISSYITINNSADIADNVIAEIKKLIASLKELPNRGSYVKELEEAGNDRYRQLHYKPYRIIYTVDDGKGIVFIHTIIDGRRDLNTVLKQIFIHNKLN